VTGSTKSDLIVLRGPSARPTDLPVDPDAVSFGR
jgi:hypothetical protein